MNKQDYIKYWIKTSDDDMTSMMNNFNSGSYDWALFIGHLSLEKILKALWVKNNPGDIPPKSHNLKKIADEAKYPMTDDEAMLMLEINDFNLEARYPDYKFDFHKKCTKEFAEGYIQKIKELHKCIASQI
ncbi:MAG: HEPN domain-containing protein [Ignavibacteria bacterium]|nr:HEPN domain-containing protein [Ignavibacteria bacterium]MCU7500823.1 HEPN domain-containing protein [Ignavibacteria bacterium]MCU7520717.1 HEPN domain-containing protein [Ignavibacteria bacterium]